jgi:hypothetical protein
MVRSKKIQSRTRRNRRVRKSRRIKRTYRRRQRGGLSMNAYNAQNNNNNNSNNRNNFNIANNNAVDENVNLGLIQDLYSAIGDVENAQERVNILKAVGGWLYAVFVTRPKMAPGDTREIMILSLLHETERYLGYELDRQTDDFNTVMDELRKVYNTIRSYEEEEKYAALAHLQEMQEQQQEEYEAQYINQ